jgi:hypothetical protein
VQDDPQKVEREGQYQCCLAEADVEAIEVAKREDTKHCQIGDEVEEVVADKHTKYLTWQ